MKTKYIIATPILAALLLMGCKPDAKEPACGLDIEGLRCEETLPEPTPVIEVPEPELPAEEETQDNPQFSTAAVIEHAAAWGVEIPMIELPIPQGYGDLPPQILKELPVDTGRFYWNMREVRLNIQGEHVWAEGTDYEGVGPIKYLDAMGYPELDITCEMFDGTRHCKTVTSGVRPEEDFWHQLPVVANSDTLRPDWSCNWICERADGRVTGSVSEDMRDWLLERCEQDATGRFNCRF